MLQEFLTTCQICGKVGQGEAGGPFEKLNLSSCDHILCRQCARQRVVKDPRTQQQKDYVCPVEGCRKQLEQHDVKAILTDDEYDMFLDSDLSANMGGDFRRCPAGCGWGMLLEDASPAQNKGGSNKGEKGLDGKPLSAEAAKHRDQYRIRCRRCPDTEFCAMCNHSPYHIGFTCQGFKAHQAKRKCRYCGEEVMPDPNLMVKNEHKSNKKSLVRVLYARGVEGIDKNASIEVLEEMVEQTESLVNLCGEDECLERAANACRKIAPCGHMCMGTKGEEDCLGCLECNGATGGQAADDLCNICYVVSVALCRFMRIDDFVRPAAVCMCLPLRRVSFLEAATMCVWLLDCTRKGWSEGQRERQAGSQTVGQAGRQTDRQTVGCIDNLTERYTKRTFVY